MVRFWIATVPDSTKKTRFALPPLIVRPGALAPSMVMSDLMAGRGVLPTMMVCLANPAAKVMVLAPVSALALMMA
ncbi:hypothetical protein BHAOGJBA_0441 [Methylobacterium hispanicum]|uniref:Uncharacterized protein n=1 Tax=Methylobacterium hispanicum TaxID=270350 RepID=A0AAV4ZGB8_9HYPH|nr:hypothetical protein BHAOGJBA_0441 [Methylobacterium hispanicum]